MDMKDKLLKVDVPVDILKKYCIWTVIKYIKDGYHTQQNSSRNDLMGGFLDRWINRIPESLIFNKLLIKENFNVVNDDFFYTNEVAKNAPDVIGLVKKNKSGEKTFYPFYKFNINNWSKFDNDAPFIEMKTTRNSQMLATIAIRQNEDIEDNYYVLVESNINDNYLLYLLDKSILNINNFNKYYSFDSSMDFISGDYNLIGNPNEVINTELLKLSKMNIISSIDSPVENIGDYLLCGVFKGNTIKKYASKVGNDEEGKPISPRYLKKIEPLFDDKHEISHSFDYDYYVDSHQTIPFLIEIENNSNAFIELIEDDHVVISVDGVVNIFDLNCNKLYNLKSGFYLFNFNNFISNLYKYYYLNSIDDKLDNHSFNISKFDRIKLDSGLFSFYGNDFKNLKFDLENILNLNSEIYNISKSTIDCKCDEESSKSIYFEKNFCKLKFNNNGDFLCSESIDPISKKNEILFKYVPDNDFHLNLRFELYDDSKFRFINKNKGNFILCIDGFGLIYDKNTHKNHVIYNSFYNIEIYDGTSNKTRNIFFKIKDLNMQNRIGHPEIEFKKNLSLDENNFYIPDKNQNNIKIKFETYDNSKITIVKEKFKDESCTVLSYMNLIIDGKAEINGKPIEDKKSNVYRKIWKLTFDDFERTSKNEEYVLSKDAIISSNESCEDELINCFKRYIDKLDNIN